MKNKNKVETKRCNMCNTFKPLTDFWVNKMTKTGRACYCKQCSIEYKKSKNYVVNLENKKSYSKTHPESWKKYFNDYVKDYRAEPLNAAKQNYSSRLSIYYRKGYLIKPKTCTCAGCGTSTDKPYAKFMNKFIIKGFKKTMFMDELIKNIIWVCSKCIKKEF